MIRQLCEFIGINAHKGQISTSCARRAPTNFDHETAPSTRWFSKSAFLWRVRSQLMVGLRELGLPHGLRMTAILCVTVILVTCGGAEEREKKYIDRGKALFEQGDFVKAGLEFKNALQINPKGIDALYYLGLIEEKQGEFQPAFSHFRMVVDRDPEHTDAHIKLGNYYLLAGRVEDAIKHANIAKNLAPNDPKQMALFGKIYFREGKLEKSKEQANLTLSNQPNSIEAASLLAGVYSKQGNKEKALEAIDNSLAANNDNVPLRLFKIKLLLDQGDVESAAAIYEKLFAIDPENYSHRVALARLYVSRDRIADAEQVLREAIEQNVGGAQAKLLLVELLARKQGFEVAERELVESIKSDPEKYPFYFRLADLYTQQNMPDRAERVLHDVIERDDVGPNGLQARLTLAKLRIAANDRESAQELIDEVVKEDPANTQALLVKAGLALEAGNYDEAITDLRLLLRETPEFTPGLKMLAQAQVRNGDVDLAMDTMATIVLLDTQDVQTRERLALLAARQGNHEEALRLLEESLEIQPDSATALQAKARILIADDKSAAAEDVIAQIIALPEQKATGNRLAAKLYQSQGQHAPAIAAFKKALELEPGAADLLTGIAQSYAAEDRLDEGILFLETVTSNSPDNASAHNLLGQMYARQENFAAAETAYQRAIDLRDTWPFPYLNLAQMQIKQGEIDEAIQTYEAGLTREPDSVALLFPLALSYERNGKHTEAIRIYEIILEKNPDLDAAANNFAALLSDFRFEDPAMLERAYDFAKRFENSDNGFYLDTLGWIYYRMGEYDKAASLIQRAAERESAVPQIQYHLGMVLKALGEHDRAREALQKAVSARSVYPGIDQARTALSELLDS